MKQKPNKPTFSTKIYMYLYTKRDVGTTTTTTVYGNTFCTELFFLFPNIFVVINGC